MAECLVQVQNSVFINYCQVKIRRETRSSHALQEMTTEVKKEVCLNMWDRYLVNWESRRRKEEGGPELEERRECRGPLDCGGTRNTPTVLPTLGL